MLKKYLHGKLIDHPKVKINKTVETELDKYLYGVNYEQKLFLLTLMEH